MNVPQCYITSTLPILFVYLITDYLRTLPTAHIICVKCYSDHRMNQQECGSGHDPILCTTPVSVWTHLGIL